MYCSSPPGCFGHLNINCIACSKDANVRLIGTWQLHVDWTTKAFDALLPDPDEVALASLSTQNVRMKY